MYGLNNKMYILYIYTYKFVTIIKICEGVSLFNGAKWNGMTLKIQEAKPNYKQRQ